MRTSRILLGFFNAPVLCLLWLTKHAVDSAELTAPGEVTGRYGGSVTVSCQYDRKLRNYTKYWCKGQVYERCSIVVKTPRSRDSDRISIQDDKKAGVFNVTMTSLSQSDEDMYWCVIARFGRNPHVGVRLKLTNTVLMTTTSTPLILYEEASWWMTLRWILIILMLSCVSATHIFTWRIKTARKTWPGQQLCYQNSQNIE
ncbi:CMRF35-like molecule 3 [Xyrichtys novacula]|uniref:CMRF35-like molecule 3 n=1 Tax=Xyrichtys novacula TaxID=13765 RepID=A0AAV1HFW7_XYRNO|nr:CMRF35-like molecule 3 [Xyrichtys novacula]